MLKDEKLDELNEELQNIKWDVLGLSETRRKGEQLLELPNKNMLYYRGNENETLGGVGFMVNKKVAENITKYVGISNRVAYLTLTITKTINLKIIQVYAPTSQYDDDEVEVFYEEVTQAISQDKCKHTIVMGDLNAKLGRKEENQEDKIGPHGLGDRNHRGRQLANYLEQNRLYAMNTFFNKRPERKWTWISPDGKTKNQIDYIISSHKCIVKDVSVLNRFTTGSDHRLVRGCIEINAKMERFKMSEARLTKIDTTTLEQKTEEYQQIISQKLQSNNLTENMTTDEISNTITTIITESGELVAKKQKRKHTWISEETKDMFKKRREMIGEGKRGTAEFANINKLIREKVKEDKTQKTETQILKFIEKNKGIKCLKNNGIKPHINCIIKENTEVRDKKEIICATEEFYTNLYTSKCSPTPQTLQQLKQKILNVNSEDLPDIEEYEIEDCLGKSKNNKTPGNDGVINELLKKGGKTLIQAIKLLFNKCLHESAIPTEWNVAKIILLFKKGDRRLLENYRPITLLSHLYKLLTKVITARLTRKLDYYQPIEQAGFREGFSTNDHLLTVRILIEKSNEYNIPLYLIFVDYEKAFDSLEHWAMERALQNCRIDSRYIQLLHNIYEKASAIVSLQNDTNPINIKRGIRQGDTLSPKLFITALEDVFKKLNWNGKGVNINGEWLNNLRFADDIVLVSDNLEDIRQMFQELKNESENIGLKINLKKTKIMTNTEEDINIAVDNTTLEKVSAYIYLGQEIRIGRENQTAEIDRRLRLGWAAFGKTAHILKNQRIPLHLRSRVFNQCILPVLTYGAQTWTFTKANLKKIAITQRAMERQMLNIRLIDRRRNSWIRERTKVIDAIEHVASLKWRFCGHTMRQDDNRWNKRLQFWRPWTSKRGRGRPPLRWQDDIKRSAGLAWRRMAENREHWRSLREAFVQQWTNEGL